MKRLLCQFLLPSERAKLSFMKQAPSVCADETKIVLYQTIDCVFHQPDTQITIAPSIIADETKIVLHQTIDSVLRRGEKLDNLVDKSNDLSLASQMFYKQARKTNSCCSYA